MKTHHTWCEGLVHQVQPLPKGRVQVAVHMGLYAMLTQLAIDGVWTGPVDLAPDWHTRVQNSAEGVVAVCQEYRAAPICPGRQQDTVSTVDCIQSMSQVQSLRCSKV